MLLVQAVALAMLGPGFSGVAAAEAVRTWRCEAVGQFGLNVPAVGEGEASARTRPTPLTIRLTDDLPAREVELVFDDEAYRAAFGQRFTQSDAVISSLRDVLRVASTGSSGMRSLVLEKDRAQWRFVLTASGFGAGRKDTSAPSARVAARTFLVSGGCMEGSSVAAAPRQQTRIAARPAPASGEGVTRVDLVLTSAPIRTLASLLSSDKPTAGTDMLALRPLSDPPPAPVPDRLHSRPAGR